MSKIDCSNVLNYAKELNRMCHDKKNKDCCNCEFYKRKMKCVSVSVITQDHIDIVQKWSDENHIQTRKEKLIKILEENGFEKAVENKDYFGCVANDCPICVGATCEECENYWNNVLE